MGPYVGEPTDTVSSAVATVYMVPRIAIGGALLRGPNAWSTYVLRTLVRRLRQQNYT